jgi:hypothetical protein
MATNPAPTGLNELARTPSGSYTWTVSGNINITGATGAGGYLRNDAVNLGITGIELFMVAGLTGAAIPTGITTPASNHYYATASKDWGAGVWGPRGNIDYTAAVGGSDSPLLPDTEYRYALCFKTLGGIQVLSGKARDGTSASDPFCEFVSTTVAEWDFVSEYTIDQDDLTTTGEGSGITHMPGGSVVVNSVFVDNQGNQAGTAGAFAASPSLSGNTVNLRDKNREMVYSGYKENHNSPVLAIPQEDLVAYLGSPTPNFCVEQVVTDIKSGQNVSFMDIRGNYPRTVKIWTEDKNGTKLNESYRNFELLDTGNISNATYREDAIKFQNNQVISDVAHSGGIILTFAFEPDQTVVTKREINLFTGDSAESVNTDYTSWAGTVPLNQTEVGQTVRLTSTDGYPEETDIYFKAIVGGSIGYSEEIFQFGPCKIATITGAENLDMHTVGNQTLQGSLLIKDPADPTESTYGLKVTAHDSDLKLATTDGYSIESTTRSRISSIDSEGHSTATALLGGSGNLITGNYNVIAGGATATISGGDYCFIGGGSGVDITGSNYSSSVGGYNNDVKKSDYSVIAGGYSNQVNDNCNTSIIGGGYTNQISGTSNACIIAGGYGNKISGADGSAIGGGSNNTIQNASVAFIGAGGTNVIEKGSTYSLIAGGLAHKVSGTNSAILGGSYAAVSGDYCIAGGRKAHIPKDVDGALVLADGQDRSHISSGDNTALLDYAAGTYVTSTGFFNHLHVSGVPVGTGGGGGTQTLQSVCDNGSTTTTSVTIGDDLIVNTDTLLVDVSNDNVGIGTQANDNFDLQIYSAGAAANARGANLSLVTINNNETGSKIRFTESTSNFQGAYLHYDGNSNGFNIGVHENANTTLSDDIDVISIDRASAKLSVAGDLSGSASFLGTGIGNRITNNHVPYLLSGDVTISELGLGTAATKDVGISNNNVIQANSTLVDNDFLRIDGTQVEGRSASEVLSDIGGQASLTFGISNTNAVKIDSADVADDEYARFTSDGLESRSTSEVLSDIGAQASLTFGISNTNAVKIDSASVADDEYARFTANGLESRSTSEVKSDIGLSSNDSPTFNGLKSTGAAGISGGANFIGTGIGNRITAENGKVYLISGDVTTSELGLGTAATKDVGISNNNVIQANSTLVDNDFLRIDGTQVEGRSASEVLSDIGGQASLTFGIANTNAVKIDSADVADDEYARFTADGLESRSTSEVLSDIGAQASLTFGISNTNAVKIDSASVADDEYARFTANGLESRSTSEVKSDIGLSSNDSPTFNGLKSTGAAGISGGANFIGTGVGNRITTENGKVYLVSGDAQGPLTFGISDTNAVKIDSATVADNEYARFTADGLESRSTSEVLSDIGGVADGGSPTFDSIYLQNTIYHDGDTDTRIDVSADTIQLATAGTTALTVASNSNVGIGTATPNAAYKLHTQGLSYATGMVVGGGIAGQSPSQNGLIVEGKAAVGYYSTNSTLGVYGNASVGTSYIGSAAPSNGLIVQGSVGIGTASPNAAYELHTHGLSYATGAVIGGSYAGQSPPENGLAIEGNTAIGYYTTSNNLGIYGSASVGTSYISTSAPSNGLIVQGNVGVGTQSPATALEVDGAIKGGVNVSDKSADFTLGSSDNGNFVNGTSASFDQISISSDLGSNFNCSVMHPTSDVEITGSSSMIINGVTNGIVTLASGYQPASIVRIASNSYAVFGNLL